MSTREASRTERFDCGTRFPPELSDSTFSAHHCRTRAHNGTERFSRGRPPVYQLAAAAANASCLHDLARLKGKKPALFEAVKYSITFQNTADIVPHILRAVLYYYVMTSRDALSLVFLPEKCIERAKIAARAREDDSPGAIHTRTDTLLNYTAAYFVFITN